MRTGQWRGAIWTEAETGVRWLVAGGLAKGEHEEDDDFYGELAGMFERGRSEELLPTADDRRLLKIETVNAIVPFLLFRPSHQSWWLVALILVPDVLMLGYVGGTKLGAACYNLAHSQTVPILLCLAALEWHHPLLLPWGSLWLAHIGLDRALAFGLKYDTDFQHTHLGDQADKQRDRPQPRTSPRTSTTS